MARTHAERENSVKPAILVVADDLYIRVLAQAILSSKGHRVLLANDAQTAARLLTESQVPIRSVAVRVGMPGLELVRDRSLWLGARPWTFHANVDELCVRVEGLESGADWESAASEPS
jgi:DNA-binding response OmpR family regulator